MQKEDAASLFRNVEKLKAKKKKRTSSPLVLSPTPFRNFHAKNKSAQTVREVCGSGTATSRVEPSSGSALHLKTDSRMGTAKNRMEHRIPATKAPGVQMDESAFDMDFEETSLDLFDDESLYFPHVEVTPPVSRRKNSPPPEEEEQVYNELFSILHERRPKLIIEDRDDAPETRPHQRLFYRMESDEDLANLIQNFSSPPPRVSNPISQNKGFGAGGLPSWMYAEAEPEEEEDIDFSTDSFPCKDRKERILRSHSTPAISL